jgi:hypothetical protein
MWTLRLIGVVLCLVGAVFVGQGIGLIGGSFMSGKAVWAVLGAVAVLFGLAFLRGARRYGRAQEAGDV